MCISSKPSAAVQQEVIKQAVQADASVQKPTAENRNARAAVASQNIKTSGSGLDDDVVTSKKRLLGE